MGLFDFFRDEPAEAAATFKALPAAVNVGISLERAQKRIADLTAKLERQLGRDDVTPEMIDETQTSIRRYQAIATLYETGGLN